eukprot:5219294-Amphidinium_carterae.1
MTSKLRVRKLRMARAALPSLKPTQPHFASLLMMASHPVTCAVNARAPRMTRGKQAPPKRCPQKRKKWKHGLTFGPSPTLHRVVQRGEERRSSLPSRWLQSLAVPPRSSNPHEH